MATYCTDLEKKMWENLTIRSNSENLLTVIKELAWILWPGYYWPGYYAAGGMPSCHPSLLMAMLHSLIARRRFGPQTQ